MSIFLVGLGVLAIIALFFIVTFRNEDEAALAVVSFVFAGIFWAIGCEAYWNYQSQPKRYACEAQGMDFRTRTFSDSTVCIPRYRGADSLNITGVR